jgi:Heat induced stress protein YflT domain
MMAKLVTGLFRTRVAAEAAVDALIKRGYTREEISVLMSDATRTKEFAIETGTRATEGAGIGGAVGGTLGAIVAAVAAVGTNIVLPGLGLVIAGPLAAALAGAGAGGAVGGVVGALVGVGIPEHRAKVYEAGLHGGGILIGVEAKSDEDADVLERLISDLGAEHVRQE